MMGKLAFAVAFLILCISCCFADPDPYSDGKYDPNKYNTGRYIPSSNEGKYVHRAVPYVHVHDSRELGQYHHIHIPYDGGYGPYNGTNIPYLHDANGYYDHDKYTVSNTLDLSPNSYDIPIPEISLEYGFPDHTPVSERPAAAIQPRSLEQSVPVPSVPAPRLPEPSVSTPIVLEFSSPEPSVSAPIVLEPSVPEPSVSVPSLLEPSASEQTLDAGESVKVLARSIPEKILEVVKPEGQLDETTTVETVADSDRPEITIEQDPSDPAPEKRAKRSIATNARQQSILALLPITYITTSTNDADQNAAVQHGLDASKILIDSQTTTTTTTTERPRVRYDNQGGWRIIRQEETKKHHKYDYLYLTENGIYAEEQARLRDEQNRATGTNSKGYYEYTGDDGKLYRVHYTVGEQGFVPEAEHIPTTPPVPLAIQRALDYVASQQRSSSLNF